MLLEILIGVCVFIVLLGVGAIVFFNEREAKEQRSKRIEQALTITIGRQEFDTQVQALMHANAEAVRKAGLVPSPPPMKDGRGKDVSVPVRQYASGGYVSPQPVRNNDAYVLAAVSDDFTPSTRTCSSSSSSSSYSSSGCSGSSSSSSSDSGSSSSSCD